MFNYFNFDDNTIMNVHKIVDCDLNIYLILIIDILDNL